MDILISVVIIVFGVLQIILFFKLWGMTNDIREIKEKYLSQTKAAKVEPIVINPDAKFQIGMRVVNLNSEKQMIIERLTEDGRYICHSDGLIVGTFSPTEIMELNEWSARVSKNQPKFPIGSIVYDSKSGNRMKVVSYDGNNNTYQW